MNFNGIGLFGCVQITDNHNSVRYQSVLHTDDSSSSIEGTVSKIQRHLILLRGFTQTKEPVSSNKYSRTVNHRLQ